MTGRKDEPVVPGRGEARPQNGGEDAAAPPEGTPETSATAARGAAAADAAVAGEESAEMLRDRWLRAEAELQNFRRRARRDAEEATRFAEERMLLEIIELLDDLERAVAAAGEAGAPGAWISGVKLVVGRMQEVLARHAVETIDPVGESFDPERHEAMLEIEDGGEVQPGHVAHVVRKGYRRRGRVLRAARVVVARAAAGDED